MGLSSYPPGVSGNELEIAGPSWEGEVTRTCTQSDVAVTIVGRAVTIEDVVLPECPCIDMEVYAWAYEGVLHWECPVCGAEYEEDGRDD